MSLGNSGPTTISFLLWFSQQRTTEAETTFHSAEFSGMFNTPAKGSQKTKRNHSGITLVSSRSPLANSFAADPNSLEDKEEKKPTKRSPLTRVKTNPNPNPKHP